MWVELVGKGKHGKEGTRVRRRKERIKNGSEGRRRKGPFGRSLCRQTRVTS